MKIDFGKWKEFYYADIFVIKKGFYNKKPDHLIPGNIPFLGATEKNNGVTEYYSVEDIANASKTGDDNNAPLSEKIFPAHALCVTNNGSVGFAYYQSREFTCSHDVNPLYIIGGCFNEYTALFVATVIKMDRYRWAYGRKWRPERMVKSKIMLPATEDEKPDWDYMESYIKKLRYKHITTNNMKGQTELGIDGWKEFTVGDLFDVINGRGITQEEIEQNPGDFVAVQSGEDGNGCIGKISKEYCKEVGYAYVEEACLTVARSGSAGYISYQQHGCVVGDSAKILILKERMYASNHVYLFMKTILMANKYKYTYGRKVTEEKYLKEKIMLPVTETGEPDWNFMEQYVLNLPFGDKL